MAWSGILIYWAHQAYVILPKILVDKLNLHHRLAEGMGWHFLVMWIFALNGLGYCLYLILSGDWRNIFPRKKDFQELLPFVLHDLKILKTGPDLREIYNPAQKMAYTSAILMGAGLILTGAAIFKPVQLGWLTSLLGGYEAARLEHFILLVAIFLFFIVHILQVMRSGWNNFRAMVVGHEIEKE